MPVRCYGQRLYKHRIRIVTRALICGALHDRVVDGGLVRLVYRVDLGPHVDDTRWTKPKI
jgi:hypothetical protein